MAAKAALWGPILSLLGPNTRKMRPIYLPIQRLSRVQHRSNEVVLGSRVNKGEKKGRGCYAPTRVMRLLQDRPISHRKLVLGNSVNKYAHKLGAASWVRPPPRSGSVTLLALTLQLPHLVPSKNELSGSLRRRAKPPRPTWPLVPCSIPGRLLPARKPVG